MDNRVDRINKLKKEIIEIQKEKDKIFKLLHYGNMRNLNDYLEGELTTKYLWEKMLNNLFCHPPITVEESANNALQLLDKLKQEKELELSKEILEK